MTQDHNVSGKAKETVDAARAKMGDKMQSAGQKTKHESVRGNVGEKLQDAGSKAKSNNNS
ncbi:hypothetical protein DIPPA_24507 [Diplonema papillatum]|nr:hypothetical protein DIPPA_12244 [Diplonema papillatum]KAJ9466908.1 hypothetical protein DIPPA_24507 [Diplonema papillatum]